MTKTQLTEPVAWIRRHPDGALTAEFLEDAVISTGRKQSGAWLPMITTTQAEAYADARVREALETEAKICDDRAMKNEAAVSADEPDEASSLRAAAWKMGVCARDIRALIPPTKNEAEE